MPNLDLYPANQDWNKQTVDFPEFEVMEDGPERFREWVIANVGLEEFKRLPLYRNNEDHPLFSEL